MKNIHHYTLSLQWSGDANLSSIRNDRLYRIDIAGKPSIEGSADVPFYGDPQLHNPEELLLSALSACHMMSYLYLCRKYKIEVLAYADDPKARLKVNTDGSGQIEEVDLYPKVVLADKSRESEANKLHLQAGKLCFIANSCNFSIAYFPKFE